MKPGQVLQDVTITKAGFVTRLNCDLRRLNDGRILLDGREAGTIELHRRCHIEGVVIGPDGHPLGGAPLQVNVREQYRNVSILTLNSTQAITDEQGRFLLDDVAPGEVFIQYPLEGGQCNHGKDPAWKRWIKPGKDSPEIPVKGMAAGVDLAMNDGQARGGVVIDLSKCVGIAQGRVIERTGQPLKGARVGLHLIRPGWSVDVAWSTCGTTTDAQGRYRLEHIPAGAWSIGANVGTADVYSPTLQFSATPTDVPDLSPEIPPTKAESAPQPSSTAPRLDLGMWNWPLKGFIRDQQPDAWFMLMQSAPKPGPATACVFVNPVKLGLAADATIDDISLQMHGGDLYFPHLEEIQPFRGTLLAPLYLPPPANPAVVEAIALMDGVKTMSCEQIADYVRSYHRDHPDAKQWHIKDGDRFAILRLNGGLSVMDVHGVGKEMWVSLIPIGVVSAGVD